MDSLAVEYVSNFSYEKTGDSLLPQWIGVETTHVLKKQEPYGEKEDWFDSNKRGG